MNTLNQAIINTMAKQKNKENLEAWEWINAYIKLQNIDKPTKDEIIELYCNLANNYCLEPWEVSHSDKIFKLYNITKEDFIKILPETPYSAMVVGIKNWKPKFRYSVKEYKDEMERERFILTICKTVENISNDILKRQIVELIEKDYFESWKHLKNIMDFYNYLYM